MNIRMVYQLTSGHLLADHEADGDEGALPVSGNGEHLAEEVLGSGTADEETFVLELLGDVADLVLDVFVVGGQVSDAGKDRGGLLPAISLCEPARRFLVEQHADAEEDSGESLHGEGNNVDGLALDV